MNFQISVVIPVHDPNSSNEIYLKQLMHSIACQEVKSAELILASNHKIDYIAELEKIVSSKFTLNFFKSSASNSASNTNFAISKSSGNLIKIMHQDDLFISPNTLNEILDADKNSNKSWYLSPFDHLDEKSGEVFNPMTPKITKSLIHGKNKVGPPSIAAFKKENFIPFDERMVYMFDCDWYLRMFHRWGSPEILKEKSIRVRIHLNQASNWASSELQSEKKLTQINHKKIGHSKFAFKNECSCLLSF